MWGYSLSIIALIVIGIRHCPSLDPRENMARKANVPIELWVELRDQNDVPLRNHDVIVNRWHWHNGNEKEEIAMTTDAQGRLHVKGRDHCGISVVLDEERYLETHKFAAWFTSLLVVGLDREMLRTDWGTEAQPTICRVLRKEGPQPLVEVWGSVSFPYRVEEPVYLDLQKAEVTADRSRGDLAIRIALGDVAEPVTLSENPHADPDVDYVPGSVHYPHQTMWVEAVDGWIEGLPRDFNWYRRRVHGALPDKPAALRPRPRQEGLYGSIVEQVFMFASRNGQVSGKGVMHVFLTYGPEPDVIIFYRGVINPTGSKSFELGGDPLPIRRLGLDEETIAVDRPLRPSATEERSWDDIFPSFALTRNPDAAKQRR